MHVGNLQAAAGRLQDALDQLLVVWEQTRDQWQDENSRHIEEELLAPLAQQVKASIPIIGQMSQALQQAARECNE